MSKVVMLLLPEDCLVCGERKRHLLKWNDQKVCYECILEINREGEINHDYSDYNHC